MARETKKSVPPRTRTRTTRRGLAQHAATQPPEPATSTRPTRRDLSVIEPATSARPTRRDLAGAVDSHVDALQPAPNARGQFSISSARGVPADVVSGSIEVGDRKRRRTIDIVHLVSASKREVTVIVNEQVLTLKRDEALALARIITTAFE